MTDSNLVYVVDDDASIRRSIRRVLTLSDWCVRTFDSAEAFLLEVDTLSSGCLLLDIQLLGMGGLELMDRLGVVCPQLPIIVMSGDHEEKFESEAFRLGARTFLRKPFPMEALTDAITQARASLAER